MSVALVVGGIWTYHTFGALAQRDLALLQLSRARQEIEREEVLNVSLEATILDPTGTSPCRVLLRATVVNGGDKTARIQLSSSALVVASVEYHAEKYTFDVASRLPVMAFNEDGKSVGEQTSSVLRAGEQKQFGFVAWLDNRHTYFAQFSALMEKPDQANAKRLLPASTAVWKGTTFFVVE